MSGLIGDQPLLLDGATGTESSFTHLKNLPDGAQYLDTATNLSEPKVLVLRNSQTTKVVNGVTVTTDRHLVQISWTKKTSAGSNRTLVLNFTMAVPQDSVITSAMILDSVGHLVDLLSDGAWSGSGFTTHANADALTIGKTV